jgi:hypothetical protein
MPSRLFRSIIVFGSALGVGSVAAGGCDLYFDGGGKHPDGPQDGWHGIIDVPPPPRDCCWGIIDAPREDGWPTIADAPNDAAPAPPATETPTAPAEDPT